MLTTYFHVTVDALTCTHAACRSEQLAIDMQIARERAAAVENLKDQVEREGERRCSQLEVNMRLVLSSK